MQFAQRLHQRLLPLAILVAEENPAAVKYALSLLGTMRPDTRLPLVGLSDQAKARIADAIAAIGEKISHRARRMLLVPFRSGTAHIVALRAVLPDFPWAERVRDLADVGGES